MDVRLCLKRKQRDFILFLTKLWHNNVVAAVFKHVYRSFLGNSLKYFELSKRYLSTAQFVSRVIKKAAVTKSLAL